MSRWIDRAHIGDGIVIHRNDPATGNQESITGIITGIRTSDHLIDEATYGWIFDLSPWGVSVEIHPNDEVEFG
jgi:hypothetical protein